MIFIPALLLRIASLFSSPLWGDELLSLQRARLPFWEHMSIQVSAWEILLRVFAHPWLIRLPALACSMFTLWLAWRIMQLLGFTDRQRIAGMAILSVLPGMLWLAQDARYYSGVMLLFATSLIFALENRWLGLFAVAGLSIYVHPIAPAYMVPAYLILLLRDWRRALPALALPAIWAPRLAQVFSKTATGEFWLERTDAQYMLSQYTLAIGVDPAQMALSGAFLVVAAVGLVFFRPKPEAVVIYLVPLAVLVLFSVAVEPVAFYRTMQPSLLGLGLMLGSSVPNGRRALFLLPLALILGMLLSQYDPSLRGGHMDSAATALRSEWRSGDCIKYQDALARGQAQPYLADLPECTNGAGWSITTTPRGPAFARTDYWQIQNVYFYAPGSYR